MKVQPNTVLVRASASEAKGLTLPAVIAGAGERAGRRFVEFFTANIRNPNTRAAYARAVGDFFAWLEERNVTLERALQQIAQRAGVSLSYSRAVIPLSLNCTETAYETAARCPRITPASERTPESAPVLLTSSIP